MSTLLTTPTPTADQLMALEHTRTQALLRRDTALSLQLHAADYQLITPSGVTFTRERYLGMIDRGQLQYLRWDAGAMAVRLATNMAIVRYPVTLQLGGADGPGTAFKAWHTDSYEWLEGRWQAVWSQATALKPAD